MSDPDLSSDPHKLDNANAELFARPTILPSAYRAARSADCSRDATRRGKDRDESPTHRDGRRSESNRQDPPERRQKKTQYASLSKTTLSPPTNSTSSGIERDERGHDMVGTRAPPPAYPHEHARANRAWRKSATSPSDRADRDTTQRTSSAEQIRADTSWIRPETTHLPAPPREPGCKPLPYIHTTAPTAPPPQPRIDRVGTRIIERAD